MVDNEDLMNRLDELIEQQKRIADSLEFIGLVMTKDWYKGNDLGAMQCSRIHNDIKKMVGDE